MPCTDTEEEETKTKVAHIYEKSELANQNEEIIKMEKNIIQLECDIGKTPLMKFLIDTGASISILKMESLNPKTVLNKDSTTINGVFQSGQETEGHVIAKLSLENHTFYCKMSVLSI